MHYVDDGTDRDKTNWYCFVEHPERFHTYAVEWTPEALTFFYDGEVCLVKRWRPAEPLVKPQPFDEPYFLSLTQNLGSGNNARVDGVTPFPATMRVDYVKVWS